MKAAEKEILTTLAHEFWCCKREFENFISSSSLAITQANCPKEIKLTAFTSYGNFIRHLFCFYEGIITERHSNLLVGCKNQKEIGEKISNVINDEVRKLIRNKINLVQSTPNYQSRDLLEFKINEFPLEFGTHFRQFRNRFSHPNPKRVIATDLSLMDFFIRYHKYILLLFETANFSWGTEKYIESYDWLEIENFMSHVVMIPSSAKEF